MMLRQDDIAEGNNMQRTYYTHNYTCNCISKL